jgi:large subunit ribosomal protein L17
MRHRRAGRKLGRNATHRLALFRNLTLALFRHERIITTLEKAKAVRPFVEKLITLARKAALNPEKALHARRLVLARLGPPSNAQVAPAERDREEDTRKVIVKLFTEIGPRFKDRPGGYTRVIKRHQRRLGDGGRTAFLELLKEGETKIRTTEPQAPAPRVEDEPEPPTEELVEQTSQPADQEPTSESPAPEGGGPATTGETPTTPSETPATTGETPTTTGETPAHPSDTQDKPAQ